ncbi:MAG: helix-turn-helix domain-containing protein [Romboutsia sp.]|uniref:helix-turn-helix domain-containing protein n=1 Tax=Romboutsia sp. TaxID=1965302 RepID=UPI003F35736F
MEKLQIGQVIKLLRKEKEITQEQLANVIGVSVPAVSKWESGSTYPDITVLPTLASFFDVTIDKLMNYKIDLSEDEINKIANECEMLVAENKIDQGLNLCEKYLKRYSSNYKLKFRLSNIYILIMVKTQDKKNKKKLGRKSIEILEDVVQNTQDIELKETSLVQLSSHYMMNEEPDKAEEVLKKIYKPSCDPTIMLPLVYMQQEKIEEAKKLMQENLYKSLNEALASCMSLSIISYNYKEDMNEEDQDFDKAIKYIELSLGIKKLIPDDPTIYSTYLGLYGVYLKKKDLYKSLDSLDKMIEYMRSRNVNKYRPINEVWCYDKIEDKSVDINFDVYDMVITSLNEENKLFEGNERFNNIIKELEELKDKNKL